MIVGRVTSLSQGAKVLHTSGNQFLFAYFLSIQSIREGII